MLHDRKLTSSSYTLAGIFSEVQGFTGTPWNSKTYPKKLECERDPLSAGKTQGLIWANSQTVHKLKSAQFEEVIAEVASIQAKGGYHAFMDVGAIFNGIDNLSVAKGLLKIVSPSIQGVLFFKDNRPCVLKRTGEIISFAQSPLKSEELYIYYDQFHTTGTDFKIAGKSLHSIGKNSKMRDLEQGYMRDRQAELGARVEFILTPEAAEFIAKELSTSEVGTREILRCMEINQEAELKEQLLMASFGRIQETVKQHLHALLLNSAIPPQEIKKQGKELLELLGDKIEDTPYEQLGRYPVNMPAQDFFNEMIDQTLQKMVPLGVDKEMLQKELWGCVDLELLPPTLPTAAAKTPDQCVEHQTQSLTQLQSMATVHKELTSDQEKAGKIGPIHWNWEKNWQTSQPIFYMHCKPAALKEVELPQMVQMRDSDIWIPSSLGQVPFLSIAEVLEEELPEFKDVFDIEASYNFLPIYGNTFVQKEIVPVQMKPFEKGLPRVQNLLICKEKETGNVQVRLLSQADAGFFYKQLTRERTPTPAVEATLYHVKLGVLASNSSQETAFDAPLMRKIVQAKFFNGESLYTKQEIPFLRAWIQEKGTKRMERLFCAHILPAKKDKRDEYPGSILAKIFAG